MRVRLSLFALLATVALTLGGCADAKNDPPPGAADADTPNVNVDEGIELPDADAADTTKEDTGKEDTGSTEETGKADAGKEETKGESE